MDKELNQVIMVLSKYRNIFLKVQTDKNRVVYIKHYCVKL